jgi:transglutaminase-like putative cysteine protease
MPILSIRHVTTYHYNQPVAFGEHRMMLRPRDDADQKVIETELDITPRPRQVSWTQDLFGNHVAVAHFDDQAAELRFVSNIRLDQATAGFRAADIDDFARTFPFAYAAEDWADLKRYILPRTKHRELDRWSAKFLRENGSADTHELLTDMTQTIGRTFKHVSRHAKGVQDPGRTLKLGSGCCRDLAVMMIAALRSRGMAARFVSGYLNLPDDDDDDVACGNTHAWAQVYVPGPGWVDFDPSAGSVGNRNLVRVAVVPHPREAIPLQGTWYGSPSDHLAMKVAVKVKAVPQENAGRGLAGASPKELR